MNSNLPVLLQAENGDDYCARLALHVAEAAKQAQVRLDFASQAQAHIEAAPALFRKGRGFLRYDIMTDSMVFVHQRGVIANVPTLKLVRSEKNGVVSAAVEDVMVLMRGVA